MQKLLDKFAANPTAENAQAVVKYDRKHSMWPVAATPAQMQTFYRARAMAGGGLAGH